MYTADQENAKQLTNQELLGLWIIDTSKTHIYREEAKRRANNGGALFKDLIDLARKKWFEETTVKPPIKSQKPDIDPLITAAIGDGTESLRHLCQVIKGSNWDRIDPKKRSDGSPLMLKTPEEVDNFLEDMIRWDNMYNELDPATQHLMKMICDAYIRWRNLP